MRVATRRLRAGLKMFGEVLPAPEAELRSELGWLADHLGAVRDVDVQLASLTKGCRRGSSRRRSAGACAERIRGHAIDRPRGACRSAGWTTLRGAGRGAVGGCGAGARHVARARRAARRGDPAGADPRTLPPLSQGHPRCACDVAVRRAAPRAYSRQAAALRPRVRRRRLRQASAQPQPTRGKDSGRLRRDSGRGGHGPAPAQPWPSRPRAPAIEHVRARATRTVLRASNREAQRREIAKALGGVSPARWRRLRKRFASSGSTSSPAWGKRSS